MVVLAGKICAWHLLVSIRRLERILNKLLMSSQRPHGAESFSVLLSRPAPDFIKNLPSRLAALDGRVPIDLYGLYDNTVYPLVSEVITPLYPGSKYSESTSA